MGNTTSNEVLKFDNTLTQTSDILWKNRAKFTDKEFERLIEFQTRAVLGKQVDVFLFADEVNKALLDKEKKDNQTSSHQ